MKANARTRDRRRLFGDQPDVNVDITELGQYAQGQREFVVAAVHYLFAMNGDELATMGSEQRWKQSSKRSVFTVPFARGRYAQIEK
jgi:replication fork clamp-binding protein CrfC